MIRVLLQAVHGSHNILNVQKLSNAPAALPEKALLYAICVRRCDLATALKYRCVMMSTGKEFHGMGRARIRTAREESERGTLYSTEVHASSMVPAPVAQPNA